MATKTLFYTVSMRAIFMYRYNLAMPFFTAFCFYIIFANLSGKQSNLLRSVTGVIVCCVIFIFARSDLLRQGILLAGHRHDLAMANRILDRIESLPDLDFSKTYYFIRLGDYSPERGRMMNTLKPYDTLGGTHMDVSEIGASGWAAEAPLRVLGSRIKFKSIVNDRRRMIDQAQQLVKERGAKRWPHPSSIFIEDDKIIAYM